MAIVTVNLSNLTALGNCGRLKGDSDTQVALAQLKGIEPGYSTHDDAPDADEQAISVLSHEAVSRNWRDPHFAPMQRPRNTW